VYILAIGLGGTGRETFYVGETESFSGRLKQHRSRFGKDSVKAAVLPVKGGKSEARKIETLVIRRLVKEGFPMEAIGDIDNNAVNYDNYYAK